MRLIDADAIRVKSEYLENICGIVMIRTENLIKIINEQPTVPYDMKLKEQEVKTGKWIEQEDYNLDTYYDCSVCGESWSTVEGTPWENGMNFCPHCGARMESILCDNRTEGR